MHNGVQLSRKRDIGAICWELQFSRCNRILKYVNAISPWNVSLTSVLGSNLNCQAHAEELW